MAINQFTKQPEAINLPPRIFAAETVCVPPNTNVFINDVGDICSFNWLMRMLPRSLPNIPLAGVQKRDIEIWESAHLTQTLAKLLVERDGLLTSRNVVPVAGCGEIAAEQLVKKLQDVYGISLKVITPEQQATTSAPGLIVDDVLKTGGTMLRELEPEIVDQSQNIYATWAMPQLPADFTTNDRFGPLRQLTNLGQQVYAAFVYRGSGVSALGQPVNSISTLLCTNEKGQNVTNDLAQKYFGPMFVRTVAAMRNNFATES